VLGDASGATHFVQIVDVEVLSIVERTVFTCICIVGLPPAGMMVLVTGHDVTVVWILKLMLVKGRQFPERPDLHLRCHNFLSTL